MEDDSEAIKISNAILDKSREENERQRNEKRLAETENWQNTFQAGGGLRSSGNVVSQDNMGSETGGKSDAAGSVDLFVIYNGGLTPVRFNGATFL